jgi:hypothetical protein
MTLEQFEIDFMRDMHPEREVATGTRTWPTSSGQTPTIG